MTALYITRDEFETWMELYDIDMYKSPSHNSASIRCSGHLESGVKFTFTATAIEQTSAGKYYGRYNSWNMIKVSAYQTENFNFHGKGSRSTETWKSAAFLVSEMKPAEGEWDSYYGTIIK